MPLVHDRSLDLLTRSPAHYHCTMDESSRTKQNSKSIHLELFGCFEVPKFCGFSFGIKMQAHIVMKFDTYQVGILDQNL